MFLLVVYGVCDIIVFGNSFLDIVSKGLSFIINNFFFDHLTTELLQLWSGLYYKDLIISVQLHLEYSLYRTFSLSALFHTMFKIFGDKQKMIHLHVLDIDKISREVHTLESVKYLQNL